MDSLNQFRCQLDKLIILVALKWCFDACNSRNIVQIFQDQNQFPNNRVNPRTIFS